jgi:protein-L-isoaspartate(D-aspartate) O-methyltransferase
MRVLEIGTGTGYNAALLARIVGDTGQVTTIESDADVATGAAANLDRAGFAAVQVVNGDGAAGAPAGAPYDRLIATAGCTVLPDTWWDQLAPDGVALVPLSRGATYPLAALCRGPARGDWSGRYAGHANFMAAVGPGLGGDAGGWTTARLDADVPVAEEEIDCSPRELEDLGVFAALDVAGARLVRLAGGSLAPRLVAGLGVVDPDGGAAVLCGNRLYAAGGHAADRLREAIGRWRTLGSPDLRGYRIAVTGPGHPGADPVPGAARSWRCRRGAAAEVVSLLGAGEVEP